MVDTGVIGQRDIEQAMVGSIDRVLVHHDFAPVLRPGAMYSISQLSATVGPGGAPVHVAVIIELQ